MTTLIPKYDQGATNAINRPFNLKLQEQVSVLDFGADPTGISDSSAAFTAALAASQNVFVPAGTYIVGTIILPHTIGSGIVLRGANKETTILQAKLPNSPIFSSSGVFSANNFISEFTLKANASGSTGTAVDMTNISFSTFEEIIILGNGSGTWSQGFYFYAFDGTPYGHCYGNNINGVYLTTSCIATALFVLENNPDVNRISNVYVGSHQSGTTVTIPRVVYCVTTNVLSTLYSLVLEKFLVECNITNYAFDFPCQGNGISLQNSYIELNTVGQNLAFNASNTTSQIKLLNVSCTYLSLPTPLPINFSQINMTLSGSDDGFGADQIGPTQNILFTSNHIASTNARALDDYNEGTWNPVASGTTTAGTFSSVLAPRGYFIKVGKLVYVEFQFIGTTLSGASGNFQITGLPYLPDNGTLFYSAPNWTFGQTNLLSSGSTSNITGYTGPGSNVITLGLSNGSSTSSIPVGNLQSTFYFAGSATYVAQS